MSANSAFATDSQYFVEMSSSLGRSSLREEFVFTPTRLKTAFKMALECSVVMTIGFVFNWDYVYLGMILPILFNRQDTRFDLRQIHVTVQEIAILLQDLRRAGRQMAGQPLPQAFADLAAEVHRHFCHLGELIANEASKNPPSQGSLEASNTRFAKQTVSYFQVVTDEAKLLNAQLQASVVLGARFEAAVSPARALGGGWSEKAPAPTSRTRSARPPKQRP